MTSEGFSGSGRRLLTLELQKYMIIDVSFNQWKFTVLGNAKYWEVVLNICSLLEENQDLIWRDMDNV